MEKINESILSDEIKEHQKEHRIDHMTYLPDMEQIPSDMLEQVLAETKAYDYDSFTESDVRNALAKERRTLKDFRALLSPAALPFWRRWQGRPRQRHRNISEILSVCLLRSI